MLYKKLYKNISVVALGTALFSLPVFTACESDVVDLEPVDKFSELTAYGTEERCELAVVGAYDAAQCGMYINPGLWLGTRLSFWSGQYIARRNAR